ncbi:MAG: hypothetical protein J5860_03010 [Clostridia bacterium]|nr:hypothetical protein [Clostridia bacterium]MBO4428385.1 hypothetical protein [Clostridia bacterium]
MLKAQKESEKFVSSNVMEGIVSIRAVIDGRERGINTRKILRVLFDVSKQKSKARELAFLRAKSKEHGFELSGASADEIDKLTIGSSHGGIVALCSEREFSPVESGDIKSGGFYVMLEGIEDPYNFGYALRSIYASGADGILLSERNWMSAAGVVARASAGASEMTNIYVGSPTETIEKFKSAGYSVFAADKSKDSASVYDTKIAFPALLLIGGEKRGLSAPVLALADKKICLDYGRRFPAALSAASAASIISFEIFRQNRGKND